MFGYSTFGRQRKVMRNWKKQELYSFWDPEVISIIVLKIKVFHYSIVPGHTTEMLEIVKKLNPDKYNPRFYVVAENDENSIRKLKMTEEETSNKNYKVFKIPRSRKVKQSYWSSIFTTLVSLFSCFPLLWEIRPNLILCNGPGTCVPICFVALLFRILFINRHCKIVFVESFCRVKTLSLSGKILLYASDVFVVQWPRLENISKKILYFGRLTWIKVRL